MGSRSTWTLHLTDYDGPGQVVNSRLRTFTTHAESDAIGDWINAICDPKDWRETVRRRSLQVSV
jgi:hypothetical protein